MAYTTLPPLPANDNNSAPIHRLAQEAHLASLPTYLRGGRI